MKEPTEVHVIGGPTMKHDMTNRLRVDPDELQSRWLDAIHSRPDEMAADERLTDEERYAQLTAMVRIPK
jgi:DNA invertase Pin-like site-specific DNA recombinase